MSQGIVELENIISSTGADLLLRPFQDEYALRGEHMMRTGIVATLALEQCGLSSRIAAEHGAPVYTHDVGSLATPELRDLTKSEDIWPQSVRKKFRVGHTIEGERMLAESLENGDPASQALISGMGFTALRHHDSIDELLGMPFAPVLVEQTLLTMLVDRLDATTQQRLYPVADEETRSTAIGIRTFEQAVAMLEHDFAGVDELLGVPLPKLLGAIQEVYADPELNLHLTRHISNLQVIDLGESQSLSPAATQ